MAKKIEDMKMVIVRWRDHEGDAGWFDLEELASRKAPEVSTVGWLILEDDKYVKVVDSIMADGTMGGMNLILKECVIEITELEILGYPVYQEKKH